MLESNRIFQQPITEESPVQKAKNLLKEYYSPFDEQYRYGEFIGKGIVDKQDAENAIYDICKKLFPKMGISKEDMLKDNDAYQIIAVLAGFISGIIK